MRTHEIEVQTVAEWAPSHFDRRVGSFSGMAYRRDWIVVPVIQTRDSGLLDRCNFIAVTKFLEAEKAEFETHRFGHWGPGWYEILIVSPEHKIRAQEVSEAFVNYPIFNDDLYSEMQWEATQECWAALSIRDRIELIKRDHYGRTSILAARHSYIPDNDFIHEKLQQWVEEG